MKPAFAVDTNCIVAAVLEWHEFHERAAKEINTRLCRGERLIIPIQALLEAYSVLTRMPARFRVSPRECWELLHANFIAGAGVVALPADMAVRLIEQLAGEGRIGGQIYDAVIAASATEGKAQALLTFNPRHFIPPPSGIEVVVPR